MKWISVKDRLPKEYVKLFTYSEKEKELYWDVTEFYNGNFYDNYSGKKEGITHWIYIDDIPKPESIDSTPAK